MKPHNKEKIKIKKNVNYNTLDTYNHRWTSFIGSVVISMHNTVLLVVLSLVRIIKKWTDDRS